MDFGQDVFFNCLICRALFFFLSMSEGVDLRFFVFSSKACFCSAFSLLKEKSYLG